MAPRSVKGFDLLRALECFILVIETGSMTTAAQMMQMTQSAVSQQINNLEKTLGVSLIDRSLRPLRPTQSGLRLFDRAEKLLFDASQIISSMRQHGSNPMPILRIAVLGSLSAWLVPSIVLALKDKLPIRNVDVWSGLASEHRKALINRSVDILITSDPLYDIERLERFELFREPFILLVPPGLKQKDISLQALSDKLPLVRYSARSPIGIQIELHLRRLQIDIPHWMEFDAPDSIVATVASGQAWAISTPMHMLHGMRSSLPVQCLPLPKPGLSRMTHIVARSGELGALTKLVAETSRNMLREEIAPELTRMIPWVAEELKIG